MSAAGLNDEHRWAPYLWIGIGVVALVVVLVLLWHRHRQRVADRTMGSTFTAAGFSALMDNLSWYGQSSAPPSEKQPVRSARPGAPPPVQADLGYRAGLTAAGPAVSSARPGFPPGRPEGSQQDSGYGPPSYPPVPPPDVRSVPPPEPG